MKHIAIVEDEPFMRQELTEMLRKAGYQVTAILRMEGVAEQLLALAPDLILLDLNLPGASGFVICQEIKRKSGIPVLILTARDELRDELHALGLGADEYLTKPCRKERLLARVANVLKRFEGRTGLLEGDGFLLDKQTYTLYHDGTSLVLPPNQGKLLETLLTQNGEPVTKECLSRALWETTEFIDENALMVNLTRLKKTLAREGLPVRIVTRRGMGYQLTQGGTK